MTSFFVPRMGDDVADVVAGCAVLLSEVQNVLPPGVHPLMTCFYLYEKRVALSFYSNCC